DADVVAPGAREVLLAGPQDQVWADCLTSPANHWRQMCGENLTPQNGERLSRPFGTSMHPVLRGAWHSEDSVYVSVGVSDGLQRGSMGLPTGEQSHLELQSGDGATLGTAAGTYASFRGADDPGRYRLIQELDMVPGALSSMRSARTAWEFTTAPPGEDDQF